MSKEAKSTIPEIFYDQLDDPKTTDGLTALEGLSKVLGLGESFVGFREVNDAIVTKNETPIDEAKRDEREVGRRIVGILQEYPWIGMAAGSGRAGVTSRNLDIWTGNHLFDNFPAMFGITQHEADSFRAMVQNSFGTPEYDQFMEDIGVPSA